MSGCLFTIGCTLPVIRRSGMIEEISPGSLYSASVGVKMAAEQEIDIAVRERFFHEKREGVLIEVGAARPDYLSIGASYRERGWTVIAIEPNPDFCDMHRALGHEVLQYACSDQDKDGVDFYVVASKDAEYLGGRVSFESFSSLGIKGGFAEDLQKTRSDPEIKTIKVNVRKLDTILQEHYPGITAIDLLAIDVEGWELDVMRGLSTKKYRPRVVILENLFRSRSYRTFMKRNGYTLWKRLKPNEVYIRSDIRLGFLEMLHSRMTTLFSF
jgi:FkbM family methyltransferase